MRGGFATRYAMMPPWDRRSDRLSLACPQPVDTFPDVGYLGLMHNIYRGSDHCADCAAECEVVPASYQLQDGTLVCDTHLDIRMEN
jgi:hypothetical protein